MLLEFVPMRSGSQQLDGVNIRGDFDYSLPSLTVDRNPVLMSHVGVAQIYSLRWDK